MPHSSRYRWLVLSACFLTFVAFAFVFQLMPPLLDTVEKDFGVGDWEAGFLMSMVTIPGIFLALPAGVLVNKYGFRLLCLFATLLVGIGSLITAISNTFPTALFGRIILGVGGTFIIVGTPTIIPKWFSHKEMGKAMGVYAANMPVATILAFPAATVLGESFGWRYPFYVGTLVSLVTATVFLAVVRKGSSKAQPTAGSGDAKHALRNLEIWKVSMVWTFFNVAAIAFLSWAPALFQRFKDLPPLNAGLLASVIMYSAVVFVPVFGWTSDRIGRRKPLMFTGAIFLAIALNITAYTFGAGLVLSVIFLGVAAAMIPPFVMAIAAESLPPNLAGLGFSIVTLFQSIGVTLSAPLAGYIVQTTQSLELTFFGISLFAVAAAITALSLKAK